VTRAALAGWRAATHAALLAGAATLALPAAAASSDPGFAPPRDQPLVLSRTVVRELRDGAAIVATRRYRVTFHPRERRPAGAVRDPRGRPRPAR
jgi:hypothetical protein